ncbi:MAG: PAS domain S-box protein [Anaerolineales bacterium]|nr:PAS domain S-box protein [Anaerolineales bacterium]
MHQGNDLMIPLNRRSLDIAISTSKTISLLIIGMGCVVLAGWILNIELWKSIFPRMATMKGNTAILFILSGVSLWLHISNRNIKFAQYIAVVIIIISVLTLGEYVLHVSLAVDQLIVTDTNPGSQYPGRPSSATALSFFLIGLALLSLHHKDKSRLQELLPVFVFLIALLAFVGYIYGASSLYRISIYSSLAIHTSIGLILLSLGIFFTNPESELARFVLMDTPGGMILRRFLPISILLPILIGWIRLMGQYAGLYDTNFGLAIMVISLLISQTLFIWINAAQLTKVDIERQEIFQKLQKSEIRFRSIIDNMVEGLQLIDFDWRHIYINDAAIKNTRLNRTELVGRRMQECFPWIENSPLYVAIASTMQDHQPRQLTFKYAFPDDGTYWFNIRIQYTEEGIFILSEDITEHHQAEQALIEREMKLAKILDSLPVGLTILDDKRNVIFSNPAMKKILQMSDEELSSGAYSRRTYHTVDDTLMSPDEFPSARAVTENREILDTEIRITKEDGNIIWTNVSAVPVSFSDWKVLILTSDITPRKHAEERFHLAVESAHNAVIMVNRNREIVLINSQAEKIFGYTRKEMLGLSVDQLIPKQFSGGHVQRQAEFFESPRRRTIPLGRDVNAVRKNGEEFPVEIGLEPIKTHEGLFVMATITDMTEQKEAEAKLQETYKRQQNILDSMFTFVGVVSLGGILLTANRAPFEATGMHPDQVVGKPFATLELFSKSETVVKLINESVQRATLGEISRVDLPVELPNGQTATIDTNFAPLRDANGNIVEVIISGVDITDRKHAEEKLHELNAELEKKVRQRTAELAQANEQLKQLTFIDPLTSLYNRRGFLYFAENYFLLMRRHQYKLLIFYADLDGLKQINDTLGHKAGDEAIIKAAEALNKTFRASDLKARLGGDEFVILAIEADDNNAQTLRERLSNNLKENNLSMSVGVIHIKEETDLTIDDLLSNADEAMYVEKQKSRRARNEW